MSSKPRDYSSDSSDDESSLHTVEEKKTFRSSYALSSDEEDQGEDSDTQSDDSSLEGAMKKLMLSRPKLKNKLDHWSDSESSDDDSSDSSTCSTASSDDSQTPRKQKGKQLVHLDCFEDSAWVLNKKKKEVMLDANDGDAKPQFPPFRLPKDLFDKLYPHQMIGVQWLVGMHQNKIGGILADDMGLGKTYQTLSCIGGLIRAKTIRNALIIAPVSVLRSWEKEAHRVITDYCVKNIVITIVNSETTKNRRVSILEGAMSCKTRNPHLVIVTYGLVSSTPLQFCSQNERECWDYVVLDEGHKIKNPSAKVTQACHRICRNQNTRRLLLTGTPVQNNLKELHCLLDWSTSRRLLGPFQRFDKNFGTPIELGRDRNASDILIQQAERAQRDLQLILKPHFLQRLKIDVLRDLPKKTDYVVWTHLSDLQRSQYEKYVNDGETVQSVLSGELTSPLEAITWLKKLCGHPLLIHPKFDKQTKTILGIKPSKLVKHSAKLQVLMRLVDHLTSSGHRTLIFSQSTKILDIIERVLEGVHLSRIDGSTKEKDRQRNVELFNDPSSKLNVMLVSTKAGGLGLTLTGADRAIIYDPAWNPAEDSQAVDRCYRIGQKKSVTVYRLIAAGTVEEKIYEKQIHKDGIRRAVMTSSGNHTKRYFDRHELRKLFKLDPCGHCSVLEKLRTEGRLGDIEDANRELLSHNGIVGISSHDSVYRTSPTAASAPKTSEPFGGTSPPPKPTTIRDNSSSGIGGCPPENGADFTSSGQNDAKNKENNSPNVSGEEVQSYKGHLSRAAELKSSGRYEDSLEILFDYLEFGNPVREEKLEVHNQIASLVHSFGWI